MVEEKRKEKDALVDRSSLLDILNGASVDLLTIAKDNAGEGLVRYPLGGGSWGRLLHHAVDLLERETLGLWDKEVGVDESAGAETAPDEEHGGFEVAIFRADHVGGDDGDNGVPEPVAGGGESDAARADGQREDFADDDPCSRTPGRGEEEDEDGNECDLGIDGGQVVRACYGRSI